MKIVRSSASASSNLFRKEYLAKLLIFISFFLFSLAVQFSIVHAVTFGTPVDYPMGPPTYITNGDFNNDFKTDLAVTPQCVQPPSDLVSWWGGDNNALDMVSTNDGTLVNGATYAPGRVGQAFSFDGTNQHVEVPGSVGDFGTAAFSVDFWIYISETDVTRGHYILGKSYPDGGEGWDIRYYNGTIIVEGWSFEITSPITLNTWHHIAVSATGSTIALYIDGVVNGTSGRPAPISSTSNPFRIGYTTGFFPYTDIGFKGLIDEVEIFNRALSAAEIAAIYNADTAGKCRTCTAPPSNMIAWWDGDGDANDIIGANNGSLLNGATFAAGKVGQAFRLDGVNDFVSVPDSPQFNIGVGDFSLSLWANYSAVRAGAQFTLPNVFLGQDEGGGPQNKWIFYSTESGLWFLNGPGVGFVGPAAFTPQTDRWYKLSLTKSGSVYTFYVDGLKAGEITDATATPDVNAPLNIGQAEGLGYFNGLLDEIEIFNRALSAAEIAALYNAGSSGKCKSCTAPPSNMISWWDGDGDANDTIGTNHGSFMNGATFAAGRVGQAFSLDGANDYVQIPDSASLDITGQITMDAWIYPIALGGRIVDKITAGSVDGYMLDTAFGKARIIVGNQAVVSSITLPLNMWSHVAGVYDGTQIRVYVNGRFDGSSAATIAIPANALPLRIGADSNGNNLFNGRIDEVEIFSRALTAEEIASIYNAGSAGKCRPLSADLAITKTDDPDPAVAGSNITYTLTVANNGPDTATGITLTDSLPAEATFASLSAGAGVTSCTAPAIGAAGDVNCSIGDMTSGSEVTVTITVAAPATPGIITNTASVSSSTADPDNTNNSTTADTTVNPAEPMPDLTGYWGELVMRGCYLRKGGVHCSVKGRLMVQNIGDENADEVLVRFYLSNDATYDAGDQLLGERSKRQLAAGMEKMINVKLSLPVGVYPTRKYIIAYIDDGNTIDESNEKNNFVVVGPM